MKFVQAGDHRLCYIDEECAELMFAEVFEAECYSQFAPKTCNSIIDCGANVGFATSYFCQKYPDASVLCFEPDPTSYELLVRNVETNGLSSRVTLVRGALSYEKRSNVPFFVPRSGEYSLRPSLNQNRMPVGMPVGVETHRLSSFLEKPVDLIKMDIETGEYDVLRDLSETGAISNVRCLVAELHHDRAKAEHFAQAMVTLAESGLDILIGTQLPLDLSDPFQDVIVWAIN